MTTAAKSPEPELTIEVNLCDDHTAKLRLALCARGLEPLMAGSAERMAARAEAWNAGQSRLGYEPVVLSTLNLVRNLVGVAGADMIAHVQLVKVSPCPLCFVLMRCGCSGRPAMFPHCFHAYIDQIADIERARARDLRLMGSA